MNTIILVSILGGPPFKYTLSKLHKMGRIFVIQPEPLTNSQKQQLLSLCEACLLYELCEELPKNLIDFLVEYARKKRANLLLSFDEFYLNEVTQANLKLGLKGVGKNVTKATNKLEMYQVLQKFDLLKRKFCYFTDLIQLETSIIKTPFVIKPSSCAGSVGVFSINDDKELGQLDRKFESSRKSVHLISKRMLCKEYLKSLPFIQEEMLKGSLESWIKEENSIYSDYISVEGIIIKSQYYPIAITQKYPLLHPFIETGYLIPSSLSFDLQVKIIERIKDCLESFDLEYCGTHTEIKLMSNQEIAIIETAARFCGWHALQQIESVFKIDLIHELVQSILDESYFPRKSFEEIYNSQSGYAASINLIPIDDSGVPWESIQYTGIPKFENVISESTKYDFVDYIDFGSHIKPFSPYDGSFNSIGKVFLYSPDLNNLEIDIHNIHKYSKDLIRQPSQNVRKNKSEN